MNEKELIKKIKLLKTIQPQHDTLEEIRRDVYQQLDLETSVKKKKGFGYSWLNNFFMRKPRLYFSYAFALAVIFLIFISVSTTVTQNIIHRTIVYTKMAAATNQYKRANIAFADARSSYGNSQTVNLGNVNEINQSLTVTNTELANLKLKGEKGKYTAQQCHTLYQDYLGYLEILDKHIPSGNQSAYSSLRSQITVYRELAEKKLHMYKSM